MMFRSKKSTKTLPSSKVHVAVGNNARRNVFPELDKPMIDVEKLAVHEDFILGLGSDIGIIRLKTKLHFKITDEGHGSVNRICMPAPEQDYKIGQKVFVSGWGKNEMGVRQNLLHFAETSIADNSVCSLPDDETDEICVGHEGNSHNSGDSGGPIFRKLDNGNAELVAVVSRRPFSPPNWVGIEPKVSEFLDWIQETKNEFSAKEEDSNNGGEWSLA